MSSGQCQHSIRGREAESLGELTEHHCLGLSWRGPERAGTGLVVQSRGAWWDQRCRSPGPRERSSLPWACALQEAGDGSSSSEGSTVDFLDAEEILKKIPELADDLDEPDDCFTEGTVMAAGLPTSTP